MRFLNFKKIKFIPLISLLFFSTQISFANVAELITAIGDSGGDAVWKIVRESSSTDTNLVPGVYVRGGNQTWDKPLILGNILGRTNSSGLYQLKLTDYTNRLETFAVINGKIVFFHVNSSVNNPKSQMVVGAKDLPIWDMSQTVPLEINLPPILDGDDFSTRIYAPEDNPATQEILISIRNHYSPYPHRNGFTFVVSVSSESNNENEHEIKITTPIYLLDYQFHDPASLNELKINDKKHSYFSMLYLNRYMHINEQDPSPVKQAKNNLKNMVEKRKFQELPYLNINKGDLKNLNIPSIESSFFKDDYYLQLTVKQSYPLDNGIPNLTIKNYRNSIKFNNMIAVKSAAGSTTDEMSDDLSQYMHIYLGKNKDLIAYIDNEAHYFVSAKYALPHINFGAVENLPDQMGFYSVFRSQQDGSYDIYLFVSKMDQDNQVQTSVSKLLFKNDLLVFEQSLFMNNEFYSSEELEQRVHQNENGDVFFDFKKYKPEEEYKEVYNNYSSHYDIDSSFQDQRITVGFRLPKVEIEIATGLYYREYDFTESHENVNGIYFAEEEQSKGIWLTKTQLLIQEDVGSTEEGKSNPFVAKASFKIGEREVEAVTVVQDSSFTEGKERFEMITYLLDKEKEVQPSQLKYTMYYPFKGFKGAFYHGHLTKSEQSTLLGLLALQEIEPGKESNEKGSHVVTRIDFECFAEFNRQYLSSLKIFSNGANDATRPTYDPNYDFEQLKENTLSGVVGINPTIMTYGELLSIERHEPRSSFIASSDSKNKPLSTVETEHPKYGALQVSLFAIDKWFKRGSDNFTFIFEVKQIASGEVAYFIKDQGYPFAALEGAHLDVNGKFGDPMDEILLVYSVQKIDGWNHRFQGFHALSFSIDNKVEDKDFRNFFAKVRQTILEEIEYPSIADIKFKLLIDTKGNFYWPLNKRLRSHRLFEVMKLSTGAKLFPNQQDVQLESTESVIDRVIARVKEGSWRVKKSTHIKPDLPKLFDKINQGDLSNYGTSLFADLDQTLESIPDSESKQSHKVLLVSNDVKSYVLNSVAGTWLKPISKDDSRLWNHANPNLALYYFNSEKELDQAALKKNFEAMNRAAKRREKPVLLVDLAVLANHSKLKQGKIEIPYFVDVAVLASDEADSEDSSDEIDDVGKEPQIYSTEETPSSLYLLASEGQRFSLEEFPQRGQPEVSILLIGTEDEWKSIKSKLPFWEKNLGLDKDFQEWKLNTPSNEQRRNLILKVLASKEQLFNGIVYDGHKIFLPNDSMSKEDIRNKVIDYAVSRSQALAREHKENVFEAFMKLVNSFRWDIYEGSKTDDNRNLIIDKAFIEKTMGEIYGLPLNLRSLPDNDPLNVLAREDAMLKLYDAGYKGNFEIKSRVIEGVLNQTNAGDQKTIPASFVLFGKKGSGKTFLYTTLVKMLGLKYYNFVDDEGENKDAQAFFVNLGNVIDGDVGFEGGKGGSSASSGTMTISELIKHFDRFLKTPLGRRGFVLFDDVHLSSSGVRSILFSKLRSMFEAKGGQYQGANIRNLSLFMTFNPTQDREKISKITDKWPIEKLTPLERTVATFIGEDNKVDASFFNRWGDIINLDYFSVSAKGSELANKLSDTEKSMFNLDNLFFTVSPDVVTQIVQKFPKVNARDFLSSTVKSLSALVRNSEFENPLYLVVPRGKLDAESFYSPEIKPIEGSDALHEEIKAFVVENFTAYPVYGNVIGHSYLSDHLVNNFRLRVLKHFILSANNSQQLSGNSVVRKYSLAPLLEAIDRHVDQKNRIPLSEFYFDSYILGKRLAGDQWAEFNEQTYELYRDTDAAHFPSVFSYSHGAGSVSDFVLGSDDLLDQQPTRRDLLFVYPKRIGRLLQSYLHHITFQKRFGSVTVDSVKDWAHELPDAPPVELEQISDKIVQLFNEFVKEFYGDMSLIENIKNEDYEVASTYDAARLFMYMLDKAIVSLNWDEASAFYVNTVSILAQDMSIASNPEVQFWMFESNDNIINPSSLHDVRENIKSSQANLDPWDQSEKDRFDLEFVRKVPGLFYNAAAGSQE